ncbi:MAG TPA: cytochrome c biogenesis protein DipZ [Acidimicrobiales bacterium]|jgi:cytochrome c biogenesis protein CcdA/thiol-disulfide isomerase/thioredoxin
MAELLAIAFIGGLITGISPCVIPVLPVIMAGGATDGNRRRPFLIMGGLIVSFTLQEFIGSTVLSALGLPQSFLRWFGIGVLFALAVALIVPALGGWLEKPFARLGTMGYATKGGGFVLGLSLGLVFAPCAGPVYSAVAAATSKHDVSATLLFTALSYALGAAIPLLILSLLAQRATTHWSRLRTHLPAVRRWAGVVVLVTTAAIAFGLFDSLQTHLPGYTSTLENHIENTVCTQLTGLDHEKVNQFVATMDHLEGQSFSCTGSNSSQSTTLTAAREAASPTTTTTTAPVTAAQAAADKAAVKRAKNLPKLGKAPNFTGIVSWFNTPGNKPLSLSQLRGKVVLVDFWTYSCINCQRSLPHVEGWYNDYKNDKFVVVGVSTPEFAFEHVVSNVQNAAHGFGIDYPVAIDNNYGTWDAYNNEYWPAEYLIDPTGQVRAYDFGEGGYSTMEQNIRALVAANGAKVLPPATNVPNKTPTAQITQETYVGYTEAEGQSADAGIWQGTPFVKDRATVYHAPSSIPTNGAALNGTWTDHSQEATAGSNASIGLNFMASDVYLVLSGTGTITITDNGKPLSTVSVHGVPKLYTMFSNSQLSSGLLEMHFSPGLEAYDFTFG